MSNSRPDRRTQASRTAAVPLPPFMPHATAHALAAPAAPPATAHTLNRHPYRIHRAAAAIIPPAHRVTYHHRYHLHASPARTTAVRCAGAAHTLSPGWPRSRSAPLHPRHHPIYRRPTCATHLAPSARPLPTTTAACLRVVVFCRIDGARCRRCPAAATSHTASLPMP